MIKRPRFLLLGVLVGLLFAAGLYFYFKDTAQDAQLVLVPAAFSDLPGWAEDDFEQVAQAFGRSCLRILKRDPERDFGAGDYSGTYGDWHPPCQALLALETKTAEDLRKFFKVWFTPYAVYADRGGFRGARDTGLFTGYYEAQLFGSYQADDRYRYPVYGRPNDLVMVDLGDFRDDLKGRRIAGRVSGKRLKPYEDRSDIVGNGLGDKADILLWVDDPVALFFMHIQGSGRVSLPDGKSVRIGYAAQNGHPYFAIGRKLIDLGHIAREDMSMQAIEGWLKNNPDQADAIMNTNPSYIFFRILDGEGPVGAENVPLTPLRSLAVDRTKIPYGTPLWLDAEHPTQDDRRLQRLMIAQDTGGAIRGVIRGDVFWGHGREAEQNAGPMKSEGRYWVLLPKAIFLRK